MAIWREFDINITLKRHFLTMNKKDVLGLRPAAWNAPKMKSIPLCVSAGNAHFPALNKDGNGGKFWRVAVSDTGQNKS